MAKGILYVLTNDAMPGIVKIGKTNDIKQRLTSLDSTSVPVPFRCHYAVETDNYEFKEKRVHDAFSDYRIRPNREFFKIAPERVVSVLCMLGTEIKTDDDMIDENGNAIQITNDNLSVTAKRFNFATYGIPAGAILTFTRNKEKTCVVAPDLANVIYEGKTYSLSELAKQLMLDLGYNWKHYRGPSFFEYNGIVLTEIKERKDSEEE